MDFELRVRNIGKLRDANISIGRFTVFAGPNNTGKSYVSNLLYSFFNAAHANLIKTYVDEFSDCVKRELHVMESVVALSTDLNSEILSLHNKIEKLKVLTRETQRGDIKSSDDITHNIIDKITNIKEMFAKQCTSLKALLEDRKTDKDWNYMQINNPFICRDDEYLKGMEKSLKRIQAFPLDEYISIDMSSDVEVDASVDLEKIITFGLEYKIKENIVQNFQVASILGLMDASSEPSDVNIIGVGKFSIEGDLVECDVDSAGLKKLRQYSQIIYLESPTHWRLKSALESFPPERPVAGDRAALIKIPGHFFDLVKALRYEYTGNIAFPNLYKKLTGRDVLGGKMTVSESGSLQFQEGDRNYSLSETSMGIVPLGMLALLIERKVLNENSLLFVDEPETNLHPAWQVIMADALFELARGGVNVVITTHSTEILKWLEVHIKKHPEDKKLVALNKFTNKGVDAHELGFIDKISAIKEELTRPFAKLYTAGL